MARLTKENFNEILVAENKTAKVSELFNFKKDFDIATISDQLNAIKTEQGLFKILKENKDNLKITAIDIALQNEIEAKAATKIQALFRGSKGREETAAVRETAAKQTIIEEPTMSVLQVKQSLQMLLQSNYSDMYKKMRTKN